MPTTVGDDIETPRQWVCVSRDAASDLSLADPRLIQMKS